MVVHAGGRGFGHSSRAALGPIASLSLDFLSSTSLDSRITFTRSSQATVVDSTGKITYAPNNLITYSEQFDNAVWGKTNTTVSPNAITAPDGSLTADKLVEDTSNAQHIVTQSATVAATAYSFSVYAKAAERNRFTMRFSSLAPTDNITFDLSTGTIVAGSAGYVGFITAVGNGWYRCGIISTSSGAGVRGHQIYLNTDTGSGAQTYTGDGTSGIYLWGAQLEAVTYQTTPSTYIPTTSAAYYGPRFDYGPVTLAPKGLLVEEQRTNLLVRSEAFDNASWNKSGVTVTANATISPDGTADADALIESTNTGAHQVSALPGAGINTYTFSFYAKANGRTQVQVEQESGGNSRFTLSGSGTATALGANTVSITPLSNGWYRCTTTFTVTGAFGIYIALYNGSTSYTGNGTSGIYIWGAQLEAGAFATSYIPTVASQVTRTADVATMTGANFSSWFNAAEGTFVVTARTPASGTRALLSADDNTANNSIILQTSGTDPKFDVTTGGAAQASIDAGAVTANTQFTLGGAFKVNDFAASINGGAEVTDTAGTIPTVDRLRIGVNQAGNYANGPIAGIKFFPTRLANLQGRTV